MGQLQSSPSVAKPLDAVITRLQTSTEVPQYLSPLPAVKSHDPPIKVDKPPKKVPKNDPKQSPAKKSGGDNPQPPPKIQIPEGCVTHMDGKLQVPN